jgi:DNA-binding CsgD family transcriptional regulator/tetratricopeptide (TPR) repeat protein
VALESVQSPVSPKELGALYADTMLHGRGRECARIDALLAGARAGHSGALVLRGEAGIGKSTLLRYAADRADGLRVLRGTGTESESEFPFAAVHQLLHPVRDHLDAVPERQRSALRAAFGLGDAGSDDRFLISVAILSLLADVAEEQPVLCLVDDAQWLDGPSADALAFAARRLDAEGIVLLFAARDDETRTFSAAGLPELRLSGLDPEAARALLCEGVAVAPQVRDLLVAGTAGNPLGLRELPGSLTEDQLAGRAPLPDPLPMGTGLEQVFLERVRRQPAATQTLLLLAAAEEAGELGVVLAAAKLLGVPADALDQAEIAGLVSIDATHVVFRHPLVRSAVYRGATFLQRRAASHALAAVLDGDENADRRAWQLASTAIGPDESIAVQLERTAERARRRSGHAAAATAYERAAALTASAEPQAGRLLAAARAAWRAGKPDRARGLLDQAARLTNQSRPRAEIEHLRGVIEFANGVPLTAYASLVVGVDLVTELDPPLAAAMLAEAGRIAWVSGDLPRLAEASRRLTQLPTPTGPTAITAQWVIGLGMFLQGDTGRATALLRAAAAAAEESDDPTALGLAAAGALFTGDDAHALALFTRSTARARADGAVDLLPGLLAPMAALQMWTGRYASAAASAGEGLRLSLDTGHENPAAHHRSVLAWIAAVQGREQDCRHHAAAALARAIGHRLGPPAGIASWALAVLDIGMGRPAEAFDRLTALADAGPGEGHQMVKIFAAADLVEVAIRTGRDAQARAAAGLLQGWAAHTAVPWASALAERCQGLLADGEESDEHFATALDLHTRSGRPFDTARTELLHGEVLRRRRRRAQARTHLRAACEGFERLGAAPWAELARAELRATGETARKRDPSTVGQLTPQELLIVRLVGQGATNREVAAQLFLSPRTVDYHLHKVFTKLGMSSRSELVRLAAGGATAG